MCQLCLEFARRLLPFLPRRVHINSEGSFHLQDKNKKERIQEERRKGEKKATLFAHSLFLEWALKESGPLNERWRFNKYHRDQKFAPHFDAGFQRNKNEKTLMTFIVYLNEGFDGRVPILRIPVIYSCHSPLFPR